MVDNERLLAVEIAVNSMRDSIRELKEELKGNGQPGILDKFQDRITRLEWSAIGLTVGLIGKAASELLAFFNK